MIRIALLLLLVIAESAEGQLRGRIVDGDSRRGVPGVTVVLSAHDTDRAGTLTGENGGYAFSSARAGSYCLSAIHPAYERERLCVELVAGTPLEVDLLLRVKPIPIRPISVVSARASYPGLPSGDTSIVAHSPTRPLADAAGWWSAAALGDLLTIDKGGATQPPPPGSGRPKALYIWGSGAEQGRVMLDGAAINAPLHLGTILPPIFPGLLESTTIHSGGAPARDDGGAVYVADLQSRPAGQSTGAWGTVDLLAVQAGAEVRLGDGRGWLAAARHIGDDVIGRMFSPRFGYEYSDLFSRADWNIGRAGRLRATGLGTRESLRIPRDQASDEAEWSNLAGSISWQSPDPADGYSLLFSSSRGKADLPLVSTFSGHVEATVDRLAGSGERQWDIGGAHATVGAELEHQQFRRSATGSTDGFSPPTACGQELPCVDAGLTRLAAYGEMAFRPGRKLAAALGVRAVHSFAAGGVQVLPRVSVSSLLHDHSTIALTVGRLSQASVRLIDAATAAATDSAAADIVTGTHARLSLNRELGDAMLSTSVFLSTIDAHAGRPADLNPGASIGLTYPGSLGTVSLSYSVAGNNPEVDAWSPYRQVAAADFFLSRRRWGLTIASMYVYGIPATSIVLERPTDTTPTWYPASEPPESVTRMDRANFRLDVTLRGEWKLRYGSRQATIAPYGRLLNALSNRDGIFYFQEAGAVDAPRSLATLPTIPIVGLEWRF